MSKFTKLMRKPRQFVRDSWVVGRLSGVLKPSSLEWLAPQDNYLDVKMSHKEYLENLEANKRLCDLARETSL